MLGARQGHVTGFSKEANTERGRYLLQVNQLAWWPAKAIRCHLNPGSWLSYPGRGGDPMGWVQFFSCSFYLAGLALLIPSSSSHWAFPLLPSGPHFESRDYLGSCSIRLGQRLPMGTLSITQHRCDQMGQVFCTLPPLSNLKMLSARPMLPSAASRKTGWHTDRTGLEPLPCLCLSLGPAAGLA